MVDHFARGVPSTDHSLASILAIVEATRVRSASQVAATLVIVVASILNLGCTHPVVGARVVAGAVKVGLTCLQALAMLASFILIAVALRDARTPTIVVHEAELGEGTILVRIARDALPAASNGIAKVPLLTFARVAVNLRHAIGILATGRRCQAHIDALVLVAHLILLSTVQAGGALHLLTSDIGITDEVLGTGALGLVLDRYARGIHAAHSRIIAPVATLGHARHLNARGRVGTVHITIVANVRLVTAWMAVSIAHHAVGTLARIAARSVLANGTVVARMVSALVNVHTAEPSIVLEAGLTATGRLSVANDARSMRSTVDAVARVLAHKLGTLTIERTIGIVQTLHLLAANLVVVGIAIV